MPLTDAQIRRLRPSEKDQKISDGLGLFILLKPTGSLLWRMAYRFGGKTEITGAGQISLCWSL
jgi:hypothetical protein